MKQRKIDGEVIQSTIRLGVGLHRELSKIAYERGISMSALVEIILEAYVREVQILDNRRTQMESISKANSMNTYNFSSFDSDLGTVFVVTASDGVKKIIFGKEYFENFTANLKGIDLIEGGEAEKLINELRLYMNGKTKGFQPKLDLSSGTPFQISVWKKLLEIPYGKVKTYGEIAEELGRPNASRAVGNAVGANPIPIIVPCHRVVASNGLGGYSGGIEKKKKLLQIEGVLS